MNTETFNVGDIVIPRDPKMDKMFSKTCGRVSEMSEFIGKICKILYIAPDETARIENPNNTTLWWTLKYLRHQKK